MMFDGWYGSFDHLQGGREHTITCHVLLIFLHDDYLRPIAMTTRAVAHYRLPPTSACAKAWS